MKHLILPVHAAIPVSVVFFVLLLFHSCRLAAQEVYPPFSKLYAGFGVCSNRFTDAFSFSANQASLARTVQTSGGLFSEKPWMIGNLSQYSAVLAAPLKNAGMGVVADYAGDGQYLQWQAGLAYGRKLTERVDIGVQFNYQRAGINGYGHTGCLNAELGMLIHLAPDLQAGVHIANPGFGRKKSSLPQPACVYASCIGYEVSSQLFLTASLAKEEGYPARLMGGIQYNVKEQVFIRAGLLSGQRLLLATGLSRKNIRIDLTALIHPRLGVTPGLQLSFRQLKPASSTH